MKKTVKLLSLLMAICMLFASCAQVAKPKLEGRFPSENGSGVQPNGDGDVVQLGTQLKPAPKKGSYNEGVALCDNEHNCRSG